MTFDSGHVPDAVTGHRQIRETCRRRECQADHGRSDPLLETANTRLSQKVGETSIGKALGPAIFVSVTAARAQR